MYFDFETGEITEKEEPSLFDIIKSFNLEPVQRLEDIRKGNNIYFASITEEGYFLILGLKINEKRYDPVNELGESVVEILDGELFDLKNHLYSNRLAGLIDYDIDTTTTDSFMEITQSMINLGTHIYKEREDNFN